MKKVEGVVVVVDGQEVLATGTLPPGWSVRWMVNSITGQKYKRYHGPDRTGAWVTQAQSIADAWRKFEAARGVGDHKPDPERDLKRKKRGRGRAEAGAGAGVEAQAEALLSKQGKVQEEAQEGVEEKGREKDTEEGTEEKGREEKAGHKRKRPSASSGGGRRDGSEEESAVPGGGKGRAGPELESSAQPTETVDGGHLASDLRCSPEAPPQTWRKVGARVRVSVLGLGLA